LPAPEESEQFESFEAKLIENAVAHIRSILMETVHRGAAEVGNYVLKTFFDGDADSVASRAPGKCASFRRLVERCGSHELPIAKSWLHNSVRIAILLRALPEHAAFKRLAPSHQAELLALGEVKAIEHQAQRALEDNLSVRELRHIVRSERRGSSAPLSHSVRGRSPIVKAMQAIVANVKRERGHFTLGRIDALSDEDAASALQAAHEALANLAELVERLEVRESSTRTPAETGE
jgi:hypothetical protein